MDVMDRIEANGVELEVDDRGSGEAVVFIHGAGVADTFLPLMTEPDLLERHRLIRYRRRGYGACGVDGAPVTIGQHAADCRALLATLGVPSAHVVGHSYGGCVALQLALDAPEVVRSIGLLEPAVLRGPAADRFREEVGGVVAAYAAGDHAAAVDIFWTIVGGPEWRSEMARTVPGGPEQAVADLPTMIGSDLASVREWAFGPAEAAAIGPRMLYLYGSDSLPAVPESLALLRSWMPSMEVQLLPGANHLLHMQQPRRVAALLARFIGQPSPV